MVGRSNLVDFVKSLHSGMAVIPLFQSFKKTADSGHAGITVLRNFRIIRQIVKINPDAACKQ